MGTGIRGGSWAASCGWATPCLSLNLVELSGHLVLTSGCLRPKPGVVEEEAMNESLLDHTSDSAVTHISSITYVRE